VDGEATATHLSAFIDCHSRYVVEARYYLRQNLDILIDSLLLDGASPRTSRTTRISPVQLLCYSPTRSKD
jgi:hypothetical protein